MVDVYRIGVRVNDECLSGSGCAQPTYLEANQESGVKKSAFVPKDWKLF